METVISGNTYIRKTVYLKVNFCSVAVNHVITVLLYCFVVFAQLRCGDVCVRYSQCGGEPTRLERTSVVWALHGFQQRHIQQSVDDRWLQQVCAEQAAVRRCWRTPRTRANTVSAVSMCLTFMHNYLYCDQIESVHFPFQSVSWYMCS